MSTTDLFHRRVNRFSICAAPSLDVRGEARASSFVEESSTERPTPMSASQPSICAMPIHEVVLLSVSISHTPHGGLDDAG